MSSRWDLGWSKRAYEDGTPYFVVSFPAGSAIVEKNPRGMWNAHITLRNGDNRHSGSINDEFAAMTWAQDKIHEMTTQKVESSTSCRRSFTVKPKQRIRASYIPDMTERYPEGDRPVYDDRKFVKTETLREAINHYMSKAFDHVDGGNWYNKVSILKDFDPYYSEIDLLYECNSLDEALKWAEDNGCADDLVENYSWDDADIWFTIVTRWK